MLDTEKEILFMKTSIVLMTILISLSLHSFARTTNVTESATCSSKSLTTTNSGLTNILKVGETMTDEKIHQVASKLCDDIAYALAQGKEVPDWKGTMVKELGFKGTNQSFSSYFNNFISTHKQKMICPEFNVGNTKYPKQHFYKRIFALDLEEVFDEYFFDFDEGEVDFNAYEIVDGKKETVLDWIDKMVAQNKYNVSAMKDIGEILADEYGAVKGAQL